MNKVLTPARARITVPPEHIDRKPAKPTAALPAIRLSRSESTVNEAATVVPRAYEGVELALLGGAGVCGPGEGSGRSGTSTVLFVRDKCYVVDCGRDTVSNFTKARLAYDSLAAIFFTSMHDDQVSDYFSFFLLAANMPTVIRSRTSKIIGVYGPGQENPTTVRASGAVNQPGIPQGTVRGLVELTGKCVDAFTRTSTVFPGNLGLRDMRTLMDVHEIQEIHGHTAALAVNGDEAAMAEPFAVMDDANVKVTAIRVSTGTMTPSFAYRFDTGDASIVLSGAAAKGSAVATLAQGTDVLVHEAVNMQWHRDNGSPAALVAELGHTHTSAADAGAVAAAAGVQKLVLTHLSPGSQTAVTDEQWIADARTHFSGEVIIQNDLRRVKIV